MSDLRVVVADDDLLMRSGVVAVVGLVEGASVVAEAGSLSELLAAVATHRPDVVVTDVRMPPTFTDEGVQATRSIRDDWPSTGVVVLSQHAEPEHVLTVFEAGNDGIAYLLKENVADMATLENSIRAVATGGSSVDPAVISILVESRPRRSTGIDGLTPRETEAQGSEEIRPAGWCRSRAGI